MKNLKRYFTIFFLLTAVVAFWMLYSEKVNGNQYSFIKNADFLYKANLHDDKAIFKYVEAIKILNRKGIDSNSILEIDIDSSFWNGKNCEQILNLMESGAKFKSLGVPCPNNFDIDIVLQDCGFVDTGELFKLAKVVSCCIERCDFDNETVLRYSRMLMAIGLQFTEYDNDILKIIGIHYKKQALVIFENHVNISKDKSLLQLYKKMEEELEKELKNTRETMRRDY